MYVCMQLYTPLTLGRNWNDIVTFYMLNHFEKKIKNILWFYAISEHWCYKSCWTPCINLDKFMCPQNDLAHHGPLARYVKLRVRMRRECRERFPRHRRWAIPTCITARASRTCRDACRDRQLSVSFEIGGGGKRSQHSRRMRNLQFYVSGKRPMAVK